MDQTRCPQCGFQIAVPPVYETIHCPNCGVQLERKDKKGMDEKLVTVGEEVGLTEDEAREKWRRNHTDYYKTQARDTSKSRPLTAQEAKARDNAIRSGMKCMVCNLQLKKADSVVWCPHCLNAAHRAHLLEWLGVKGRCPICGRQLDETELKRAPTSTIRPRNQKAPSELHES